MRVGFQLCADPLGAARKLFPFLRGAEHLRRGRSFIQGGPCDGDAVPGEFVQKELLRAREAVDAYE